MLRSMNDVYDVIVVGGGAAGLTGALTLVRSRRKVLVLDAGEPRNAPAAGVHGLISRDGINPHALLELGRDEIRGYGAQVWQARAASARRDGDVFEVTLEDGQGVKARRLLVATGVVDDLPAVPGLRERWGRDVVHCAYCHGWEVRDQAVGVLATGSMEMPVHAALLFRQLTSDVVLFRHTASAPTDAQAENLAARDVRIVDGAVDSLVVFDDRLSGVRLREGSVVARQALVVPPRVVVRSELLTSLGLEPTPHPAGVGEYIADTDGTGRTVVPGVWVAGNVADLRGALVAHAASGIAAAAAINADLVAEETARAVAAAAAARRTADSSFSASAA